VYSNVGRTDTIHGKFINPGFFKRLMERKEVDPDLMMQTNGRI
jgi:hypothetical protein